MHLDDIMSINISIIDQIFKSLSSQPPPGLTFERVIDKACPFDCFPSLWNGATTGREIHANGKNDQPSMQMEKTIHCLVKMKMQKNDPLIPRSEANGKTSFEF